MNPNYVVPKEDIEKYIEKHCFFIPEKYFMTKEEMLSDSFQFIFNELIDEMFNKNLEYTMIAITSQYLKDEAKIRGGMTNYIKQYYPNLVPIISEGKHFYYICKKEIEKMVKENSKEFFQAINNMFIQIAMEDMYSYNKNNSQMSIDYEDITNKPMLLLPIIKTCSYENLTNSSVSIGIDEVTKKMILKKNEDRMPKIKDHFANALVTYRLYLYDYHQNMYITIDKYRRKNEKIIFTLKGLEDNHGYSFKISVLFNYEYFSAPKIIFYFYTKGNPNKNCANALYAYGENKSGELIDMSSTYYSKLNKIPVDIIDFSSISLQTLILLSNGNVVNGGKSWVNENENENDGSFEIENYNNFSVMQVSTIKPFLIVFPFGIYIRKVSLGKEHCVALSNHGQCFSWGANSYGQLGLGIEKSLVVGKPRPISFTSDKEGIVFIVDITSGFYHTIALGVINSQMEIYYWGFGLGNEPSSSDIYTSDTNKCSSSPFKMNFIDSHNIIKIYAKHFMSAFIVKSSTGVNHIYTFGINTNWRLGFINDKIEENMNWETPAIVSTFAYNNLSVIDISICKMYSLFIVRKKDQNANEIYVAGLCIMVKNTPIKIPEKLSIDKENIVSACASNHVIYILFKDGQVDCLTKDKTKNNSLFVDRFKPNDNSVIKMEGTSNSLLIMTKDNKK